ncbi:alpha/beta fold hydrolase [Ancylobacter sp. TS-1]|uniref:alpha/beta hydrolase family protein n=1 Tax=Ancylobacter sp. TS-1 TaxID=1850374 RepID=UPI001265CB14|nr:alpha/beta fold hydrolase [Ancylobacter sp. TS-1]QFR33874.1 alpha/beta hydrolase [Ancylobacter sp. TS-1]
MVAITPETIEIACGDGVVLGGHFWPGAGHAAGNGAVLVNPATGVLARYYHRYARFLAGHGFDVLTYDYRGIGASRPARMRGCRYRWRDWGERDVDAALRVLAGRARPGPLAVVGHSIGGFLPGLAPAGHRIDRMLTVGAQYAWWADYAPGHRLGLLARWHLAMPAATALFGYFPGRRLGWLEDLPAGVAREWAFRGPRFETSHPRAERAAVVERMAHVRAPILAVGVSDDPFGTVPALSRALAYYAGAARTQVEIDPADYGRDALGHFSLFHDSHAAGFWLDTLIWLRDGRNPWPDRVVARREPGEGGG